VDILFTLMPISKVVDVLFALTPIFIGIVSLMVIVGVSRSVIQWHRNNQQPVTSAQAKIIAKRTEVRGSMSDSVGSTSTSYYCTFELTTGQRLEHRIAGREYGLLAEGDEGILTYQGTRYRGFQRS
jgi:Protein of unknown function (DUF2500)